MKKKMIIMGLCFLLLLIFTSTTYGGFDPRYSPIKEHPEQELISSRHGSQEEDVPLLIIQYSREFLVIVHYHYTTCRDNSCLQGQTGRETKPTAKSITRDK